MLLSDFLVAREVDAKAKTADEYNQLLDGLKKRLFDAAQIDISNEAYDQLKAAAQKINRAGESLPDAADRKNAAAAQTREIMETMPDAVLARYNGTPITVKQTLAVYAQLHPPRPNLETNEALVEFLKPFILPGLMTAEAERLGIEKLPAFQDKIIQNRNTLLRFYMHSLIEAKANEELQSLGLDQQMKSWYEQHAARYAAPGAKKFPAYADVRERVEGDYSVDLLERLRAEKIRALREMHHIQIDEAALKTARAETTTHP